MRSYVIVNSLKNSNSLPVWNDSARYYWELESIDWFNLEIIETLGNAHFVEDLSLFGNILGLLFLKMSFEMRKYFRR